MRIRVVTFGWKAERNGAQGKWFNSFLLTERHFSLSLGLNCKLAMKKNCKSLPLANSFWRYGDVARIRRRLLLLSNRASDKRRKRGQAAPKFPPGLAGKNPQKFFVPLPSPHLQFYQSVV